MELHPGEADLLAELEGVEQCGELQPPEVGALQPHLLQPADSAGKAGCPHYKVTSQKSFEDDNTNVKKVDNDSGSKPDTRLLPPILRILRLDCSAIVSNSSIT